MKKIKLSIKNGYDNVINTWDRFINLKYINKLFNFLPRNLFVFILFIVSIFVLFHIYSVNNYDYLYYQEETGGVTEPLMFGALEIPLDNISLNDNPTKVCFRYATYYRKNKSTVNVLIKKGDEIVYENNFSARTLKDKELRCESIENVIDINNIKDYKIIIDSSKTNAYNTIALYKNANTNEVAMYFVKDKGIFNTHFIIIMIFLIIYLIINYFINKKKIKPEILYLIVAISYMIFIMFIIPPYQVPDEQTHFINTINLSQLNLNENLGEYFNKKEITVPENMKCLSYSNPQKGDKIYDINTLNECFMEKDNITKKDNHVISRFKLAYIFTVIGYKIADTFSNSPLILFISGRIFNTLAAIIMIFFAIKITPRYKEILLSMAAMPMFVQQMISYSYDSVLNALVLLVLACIFNLIYNDKANKVLMYIILFIAGILIANIKYLYLVVYLLLLYLPIKNKKKYINYILAIGMIAILYLIGSNLFNVSIVSSGTGHTIKNLDYILHNPLQIFPIAYHTFRLNTLFYIRGFIGYFGWFIYKIPNIYLLAYFIYFMYLILSNETIKTKTVNKVVNIIGLLIAIGSIFAAMYFWFSEPQLYYVEGVQGRYFISLVIPILILLMPKKKLIKGDINVNYSFINLILFCFTIMLLLWYY